MRSCSTLLARNLVALQQSCLVVFLFLDGVSLLFLATRDSRFRKLMAHYVNQKINDIKKRTYIIGYINKSEKSNRFTIKIASGKNKKRNDVKSEWRTK